MNIYTFYTFHFIFSLPVNKNYSYKNLSSIIPTEWQLILMNDGSFTQNLHSLTGKHININISQTLNARSNNKKKNRRVIWLEDEINNKFISARSLWILQSNNNQYIKTNKPVGQSFIESKADIYKEINEIYYGYCTYLEQKFNSKNPIWGRKYTLYYNQQSYAIIQEFFSPQLINFLH
uniref:Chorismate lyase n=1 Tax=Schimmelmannia schousboei TaxID=173468 RepID=A0A1C9C8R4_9FLOR|nr:hypothetical protein Schim_089 [Schimmelmannia schousboei]AOM64770.1 hypothetical protein Schim_089 [Schimmelmannia schousboei]